MEKQSSTAAYDDVFGGPPRFSAPFASRLGDYSEIFGGLSSSCSIPVLDLPPALDLFDAPRSSVLDYFEIFGGFDGSDIAPTYEELVAEQERVEVLPSSNGRSPNEAELGQQTTDISEFSPACSNRSHVACLAKDQIVSNDNHLNDSHKTNQGNAEDATNEAAQNAQPHVVSGFTSDIERSDDPPNEATIDHSHNAGLNGTPNEATIDHSHSAGLNGRLNDEKQGQTYSRSSSEASSKSSGNCLKSDQKQFARCPTSVDGPAYLKHHSRSSSSHSASSGDTYYPDFTYLTVSDISLRTQPLQVPPPTRPPPKFANNQDITKMEIRANSETDLDEASLSKHIPNHQKHSGSDAPKRRAPRVPVKESSFFFDVEVDASSAASAMKEAMEQAQARLKSAKESMERNRDNLKSRKKLGHKEGSKCEEGKEVASQKIIMKENKKKNEFSVEDKQKARGAAKVAPDHEENDIRVVSDELNGFRSSLPSYELNDRTGEWKTDKQFYELVHNENFADKIPKETIEVNKERENESKVADLSYEFERKGYAWEVNGTCEKEEHAKILKFGDTTTLPEEKNVNKFEEVYDSYQPVEDQSKLGQTLEAHISEEEVKKPNIGEDSPACFISACSFEVASKNKERESKLGDTKEVSECDGGVELNQNYLTCQPHCSENRLEIANKTGIEVDNNEIKTPYTSGTWEAPEEVEAAPDLSHCENSEKIRENSTAKWYQEEIPEEHKASEGGTRSRENNITEAVKEDDYEENKAREAQIGCQQDEIEQTAAQVPCELENSVMLTVALPVHKKSENQSIREVHLNMDVKEKYNILNVAQEVFERVVSKDAEEREKERRIGRERELEEREKERRVQRERELEEREKERQIEREKELEKERKLEEEREREKEREKDRVAVERATREARERAIAEARERAERIAVERITAEARQRALTEAREKAEKASAEALEKSLADKASREARLRAERVAVERVTAEARDRAAEKAAADARERVEKLNAASSRAKMRRDNEAEEHSRAGEKGDSGTRVKPSFSGTQDNLKSEVGEGDSPLRCKARLERHQRTVERAAKALAEKNMRDILAQKEQAERNRLAETLDADVRRWSTGKEGNLRALLSTLQYILGAESGWQPIPLTDVITAVAVKKAYRKATLCVHPDKLQQRGASIQQKYICEKVFDLLKDAWNRFNSEER